MRTKDHQKGKIPAQHWRGGLISLTGQGFRNKTHLKKSAVTKVHLQAVKWPSKSAKLSGNMKTFIAQCGDQLASPVCHQGGAVRFAADAIMLLGNETGLRTHCNHGTPWTTQKELQHRQASWHYSPGELFVWQLFLENIPCSFHNGFGIFHFQLNWKVSHFITEQLQHSSGFSLWEQNYCAHNIIYKDNMTLLS